MTNHEETSSEQPFDRNAPDITAIVKSAITAEPKSLFRVGYYLILATIGSLLTWATFSFTDISYFSFGELRASQPPVAVTIGKPFKVESVHITPGNVVKKGETLLSYTDLDGHPYNLLSPTDGLLIKLSELRKGILLPGDFIIGEISPESSEITAKLYLEPSFIGRLSVGNPVLFRFNGPKDLQSQPLRGKLISIPIPENDKYYVIAGFEQTTIDFLRQFKLSLVTGYPISAEIITGRERIISILIKEAR